MDIQTAITKILSERPERDAYTDYYEGKHRLAFSSEKFQNTFGETLKRMRENLCPIVVDAPADRMEIINFSSNDAKETAKQAWAIWQRELMELYSTDIHKEAFKCQKAYLIVWINEENLASFYVQDSRTCTIVRDENTDKPLYGAKMWETAGEKSKRRVRLTLYYPDRIEKYITRRSYTQGLNAGLLKEAHFEEFSDEGEFSTPNPYETIPIFEFKAECVLKDGIPIQDRLNKTICDELVAQEFAAFPQRYATGLEVPANDITGKKELPFKSGIDRLWFTEDPNTKFGEFSSANLEQFLSVEDVARLAMARVTGTPLHYFSFSISDAISGEALKTLESRFTKRIKRTCLAHGAIWSKAMKLALQIEGLTVDTDLTAQWATPEQRSESEFLDTLGKKKDILMVPTDVLREEYGYTAEDITKFNANTEDLSEPSPKVMEKANK